MDGLRMNDPTPPAGYYLDELAKDTACAECNITLRAGTAAYLGRFGYIHLSCKNRWNK
jgi:hypothetical protein